MIAKADFLICLSFCSIGLVAVMRRADSLEGRDFGSRSARDPMPRTRTMEGSRQSIDGNLCGGAFTSVSSLLIKYRSEEKH